MIFDANDPRLTAYALDEVDSAERAEIEQLLADCQEARTHVSEIRQTAQWLTKSYKKNKKRFRPWAWLIIWSSSRHSALPCQP